jgi:phosphoribosylaminoimidazole-succinocarboxamide synthase
MSVCFGYLFGPLLDDHHSQGIPDKGKLLTKISLFWFEKLGDVIPNHFITANIDEMPQEIQVYKTQLDGRAMLVKKAEVIPLEAIVRGYLTGASYAYDDRNSDIIDICVGSAWGEYKKSSTVHGIPLPSGLVESHQLPEPLFTPSTKAEQGYHDENITPERGVQPCIVVIYLNQ